MHLLNALQKVYPEQIFCMRKCSNDGNYYNDVQRALMEESKEKFTGDTGGSQESQMV